MLSQVIVWYVRADGEVVPDNREIEVSKCLPHQVGVHWPVSKAEQGTKQTLTLSAEPSALCSLGELVVDSWAPAKEGTRPQQNCTFFLSS